MKRLHILKPCTESWDSMTDCGTDKFCGVCNKIVYDFDSKNNEEIGEILKNDKMVCAKISASKNLSLSLLISVSLSIASCSPKISNVIQTENAQEQLVAITGKVYDGYSKHGLEGVKIDFYSLSKIYRTYSDNEGNFKLMIPQKFIKKINLIEFKPEKGIPKFDGPSQMNNKNFRDTQFLFTNEESKNPLKLKYINYARIGGVVISNHVKQDRYFFNGEKVKEGVFKELTNKKSGVWKVLESKEEKKAVYGKDYLDDIYLFYTNDAIEIQSLE